MLVFENLEMTVEKTYEDICNALTKSNIENRVVVDAYLDLKY